MSKANARAFLKRLAASKELVERCQAAQKDEWLKIAAALGFPHTAQEMQAVLDEGLTRAKRRLGKLSEEELEKVSGGQTGVEVVVVPVVVLRVLSNDEASASHGPLEIDL